MKVYLTIFSLLLFSTKALPDWIEFKAMPNGNVHFYSKKSVQKKNNNIFEVENRIRYKTSLMGAFSYQRTLRIDCLTFSETTLRSTFFTDNNWSKPTMKPDATEKPKTVIIESSATEKLAIILCHEK